MANLVTQQITPAGLAPTYAAAAAGGDKIAPGPNVFLHVKNTGGSPATVTVDDPNSVGPSGAAQYNPDLSVSVPATTGDRMIGPLGSRFQASTDGLVAITYSGVTGVTVAAIAI